VLVATIRAMKHHAAKAGGGGPAGLGAGLDNLGAHIANLTQFGVPVVVAVNRFSEDTDEEVQAVVDFCAERGVAASDCDIWARGGEGGLALAEQVLRVLGEGKADFRPLYELDTTLREKLETVARNVYGADGVNILPSAEKEAQRIVDNGLGNLPICIAKTQYSLSDDPTLQGRPSGFDITVREFRISAGAGFIVALTGDVMVMPGLSAKPAAEAMKVHPDGTIEGLF
jgi:formate--tetrahydrofolate ligase